MMNSNLTHSVSTIRGTVGGNNTLAAGQTDVQSAWVDTRFFTGVRAVVLLGAITAGATLGLKLQASDDQATIVDATATVAIADTADNKMVVFEVSRPRYRYIRLAIDRGTQDSALDGIIWELFNAQNVPVTQDATVVSATVQNGAYA